jgi:hypothetical protein
MGRSTVGHHKQHLYRGTGLLATSISTSLTKGTAYTITVTPTWTGSAYSEGYAVWIDYNADGDFADTGELVWSKTANYNSGVGYFYATHNSYYRQHAHKGFYEV